MDNPDHAGHLQDKDLIEQCAISMLDVHDFMDGKGFSAMSPDWQQVYFDMAASNIAVLIKRGLLNELGLSEYRKSQAREKGE